MTAKYSINFPLKVLIFISCDWQIKGSCSKPCNYDNVAEISTLIYVIYTHMYRVQVLSFGGAWGVFGSLIVASICMITWPRCWKCKPLALMCSNTGVM